MLRIKDFVDLLTSEEKDMEMVVEGYDGSFNSLKADVRFNYVENRVELVLFDEMDE